MAFTSAVKMELSSNSRRLKGFLKSESVTAAQATAVSVVEPSVKIRSVRKL